MIRLDLSLEIFREMVVYFVGFSLHLVPQPPLLIVLAVLKRLRQVNIISCHRKQAWGPPHLFLFIYT